jgi:hypothetical protein
VSVACRIFEIRGSAAIVVKPFSKHPSLLAYPDKVPVPAEAHEKFFVNIKSAFNGSGPQYCYSYFALFTQEQLMTVNVSPNR